MGGGVWFIHKDVSRFLCGALKILPYLLLILGSLIFLNETCWQLKYFLNSVIVFLK